MAIAADAVPVQPAALRIWDAKYRLRSARGETVDADIQASRLRVATAAASVEASGQQAHWRDEFLWALDHGAVPAGRIWANAGAQTCRPHTSTINCVVSRSIPDRMDGIMQALQEGALTLKAGSGIGYDFSTLRPRGARVRGAGATSSGPLSFMQVFDAMSTTVSSAGGRRGAQMGCMDIGHPDIEEFITAKQQPGHLRQFNLSVLVSGEFLSALERDADWPLAFPASSDELDDPGVELIYRPFPLPDAQYRSDEAGRIAMRVYRRLPAAELWEQIMRSAYDHAEPGYILLDEVNDMNNNWFCESIRATNPCGEQPLPPYGACLLGSLNLSRFVSAPFTAKAAFDWESFRRVATVFTRLLDNVVEIHGLPLDAQAQELLAKRRHGMGFLGLGSALTMLRLPYGSDASIAFTEQVSRELAVCGWRAALALAREKGPAPLLREDFTVTAQMLRLRPELAADGYAKGDRVPGRILHARYSRYMQRLAEVEPELVEALAETGARFTHHSCIAPTGTIALALANNASNGIEPSYSQHYLRNITQPERRSRDAVEVYAYEFLVWRGYMNPRAQAEDLPAYFSTAQTVEPRAHLRIQAAAQRWMDAAISKTINVPATTSFEDFRDIYRQAVELGLKGCTTYRFNPQARPGILQRPAELEHTLYEFALADAGSLRLKGSSMLTCQGEHQSVANLYASLQEQGCLAGAPGRPLSIELTAANIRAVQAITREDGVDPALRQQVGCPRPDCSGDMLLQDGCWRCPECGYSRCE